MMQKIRIVILDDHKLFADGLKSILAKDEDIEVEDVFFCGLDFVNNINRLNFDVLLLDLKMPNFDGFRVLSHLANYSQMNPKVKVIILSTFFDEVTINKCKELGASAYLLKIVGYEELRKTVIEIYNDSQNFICDSQIKLSQKNEYLHWAQKYKISKREWEIMLLLKQGFTSQDIAKKLHISYFTVDTHRKNILYKLDVKNTSSLLQKIQSEL